MHAAVGFPGDSRIIFIRPFACGLECERYFVERSQAMS